MQVNISFRKISLVKKKKKRGNGHKKGAIHNKFEQILAPIYNMIIPASLAYHSGP